jgi:hypothetical protein
LEKLGQYFFFGERDTINIYKFAKEHSISDVASGVGSGVSSANTKIKENILARFRALYYWIFIIVKYPPLFIVQEKY